MNLFDLKGKTALVTGSGSGIGLGMAEGLLEAGAKVVLSGRTNNAVREAKRLADLGYQAVATCADLSLGEKEVNRLFDETLELLNGRLDILINSAGTQRFAPAEEFPTEYYDEVINLNLRSVFLMCRRAGAHMVNNGYGKIINIASMLSFFGGYDVPAYAASKGGIAQLTKAFGNAWVGRGVNVNAVAPGFIETPLSAIRLTNDPVKYKEIKKRIPAGRWGLPADLKGIAVFLTSHASDYMSGCIIPVDGGYLVN